MQWAFIKYLNLIQLDLDGEAEAQRGDVIGPASHS